MKNILILILAMCATVVSEAATTKIRTSETAKLSEKIDSLTSVIDVLSHNMQAITETQGMLSVRMAETREDYMTFLNDSHETRNWTLGIISLIVGAFGVATPILLNLQAGKKSEKALVAVKTLNRNIDNINTGIMSTQRQINIVAEQINKDREKINNQLSDITEIKAQIDKIQNKIKASEENARESQQRAMISRLFAEALKEKDSGRAVELYSRILKIDSNDIESAGNRGLLYANLKQYDKALRDAKNCIKINPESSIGYTLLGYIYFNMDKYAEAIRYCNEAIRKKPHIASNYRIMALAYIEEGQLQLSINALNELVDCNQANSSDYNNRAYVYCKLGKLEVALADANEALSICDDDDSLKASILDTRGCIYANMGPDNYESALNNFNKAIKLNPQLWEAYENRASLYQKLIETTLDPKQQEQYKQLRLADLETFRKRNTQDNGATTDKAEFNSTRL